MYEASVCLSFVVELAVLVRSVGRHVDVRWHGQSPVLLHAGERPADADSAYSGLGAIIGDGLSSERDLSCDRAVRLP